VGRSQGREVEIGGARHKARVSSLQKQGDGGVARYIADRKVGRGEGPKGKSKGKKKLSEEEDLLVETLQRRTASS